MKNKHWIALLAAILFVCLGISLAMTLSSPAGQARITSCGQVIRTVDLRVDQEFTVTCDAGSNTVTVRDGKIAVTSADCPDRYCVEMGFRNSGTQIVCLPHRLIIEFVGEEAVDFAA